VHELLDHLGAHRVLPALQRNRQFGELGMNGFTGLRQALGHGVVQRIEGIAGEFQLLCDHAAQAF